MKSLLKSLLLASLSVALYACGGSGGKSGPDATAASTSNTTASDLAFALQASYLTFLQTEKTVSFQISGTCTGQGTVVLKYDPDQVGSGTVSPGFSDIGTDTATYTNCTQDQLIAAGLLIPDTEYDFVYGTITSLPTSAKVGDAGMLSAQNIYPDTAKTTRIGTIVFSYTLEPDTATTAILNITAKRYDTSNTAVLTKQSRFKVDAAGNLTATGIELKTPTAHLVFAAN